MILWNGSTNDLVLYTSTTTTKYRVPTLMHDHTYRMGICWQNSAYNQPPHLGYYLPDAMLPTISGDRELTVNVGDDINWVLRGRYATYLTMDSKNVPAGISFEEDFIDPVLTLTGSLAQAGDYELPVIVTGLDGKDVTSSVTIHAVNATGIEETVMAQQRTVYDLQGRQRDGMKRGLNIVREGNRTRKILVK